MINGFYYSGKISCIKNEMLTSTLTLAKTGLGVGNAKFVDQILSSVQYSRLTKDEKDNILCWIQGFNYDEEHLLCGLKKMFEDVNLPVYFVNHVDICYEKVMDELGDIYARELHTGLLFPLVGHMCKFGEFNYSKNKATNHFEKNTTYYEVKHIYQLCNKSIQPILSYVSGDKVIGKDEVKEYLKSMEALKENSIKGCYDKNVIDSEIIIKDLDKKLAEKDLVSLYIEDIELSLFKLENLNEDLYTHALDYYHAIINSRNSNNNKFNSNNLKLLSYKLKTLVANVQGDYSIDEELDLLLTDHINSIKNKESKFDYCLVLNDLINIDKRDGNEKREYYVKLALLYIIDLYNNNRSIKELKETGIEKDYKTILLNIMILKELGYVDVDIDYKKEYTFEETINLLYNMNFINMDNNMIKKLRKGF